MKKLLKVLALLAALVMLVTLTACTKDAENDSQNAAETSVWDDAWYTEDTTLGEGEMQIQVEVKAEDKSITFTINTDAQTLGDALLTHSLIEGESSQFGMYVKSVNQIRADYDLDGYYWAVYKDGGYLETGVDSTVIADGDHYELVREK